MLRGLRILAAAATTALAAACASTEAIDPPSVQLTNITLGQPGLLAQEILLDLRVSNSNDIDIPLRGLTLQIDINGRHFAEGLSDEHITLPRLSFTNVEVKANVDTLSVLRQLFALALNDRITYRLSGFAYVGGALDRRRVPYERSGELSLRSLAPALQPQPGERTFSPLNSL